MIRTAWNVTSTICNKQYSLYLLDILPLTFCCSFIGNRFCHYFLCPKSNKKARRRQNKSSRPLLRNFLRKYPSVGHSLSPWALFVFLGGSITRSVSYAQAHLTSTHTYLPLFQKAKCPAADVLMSPKGVEGYFYKKNIIRWWLVRIKAFRQTASMIFGTVQGCLSVS